MLLDRFLKYVKIDTMSSEDGNSTPSTSKQFDLANILVDECLKNRGEIRAIDITEDKGAIEIWLIIDEEAYCYYFFPYGQAVIEI